MIRGYDSGRSHLLPFEATQHTKKRQTHIPQSQATCVHNPGNSLNRVSHEQRWGAKSPEPQSKPVRASEGFADSPSCMVRQALLIDLSLISSRQFTQFESVPLHVSIVGCWHLYKVSFGEHLESIQPLIEATPFPHPPQWSVCSGPPAPWAR